MTRNRQSYSKFSQVFLTNMKFSSFRTTSSAFHLKLASKYFSRFALLSKNIQTMGWFRFLSRIFLLKFGRKFKTSLSALRIFSTMIQYKTFLNATTLSVLLMENYIKLSRPRLQKVCFGLFDAPICTLLEYTSDLFPKVPWTVISYCQKNVTRNFSWKKKVSRKVEVSTYVA